MQPQTRNNGCIGESLRGVQALLSPQKMSDVGFPFTNEETEIQRGESLFPGVGADQRVAEALQP